MRAISNLSDHVNLPRENEQQCLDASCAVTIIPQWVGKWKII